jgi:riboflavin kinase/FMN adenylyltransferase
VKVYFGLEEFHAVENAIVTTGTFDGVHIGHRKIIKRIKELAVKEKGQSVLLTFHPHPRLVLFPQNNDLKLITTQEEKIDLLDSAGIDHLIIHPFTKDFSRLTAVEYVRDILVNTLQTKRLVIGYDHHFGRNRDGSLEHLREFEPVYNFTVEEIPAQDIDEIHVSSTKIREALQKGDVQTASAYLGYNFILTGKVVKGNAIGKSMGFPTANLDVYDKHKIIPADGVYAVICHIGNKSFSAMLNIGIKPTVSQIPSKTIEVHIFNFDQDIYGENIRISFVERIRDEKKFENTKLLIKQLEIDKYKCLQLL